MDREMVVKWFEFCRVEDKCSTDCPYFDNTSNARECTKKLAKDVLTLLKEQKAIEPISDNDGWYWCGACHENIVWHQRFCSNCGRAVKWE